MDCYQLSKHQHANFHAQRSCSTENCLNWNLDIDKKIHKNEHEIRNEP
jgi:hypothetical protein